MKLLHRSVFWPKISKSILGPIFDFAGIFQGFPSRHYLRIFVPQKSTPLSDAASGEPSRV